MPFWCLFEAMKAISAVSDTTNVLHGEDVDSMQRSKCSEDEDKTKGKNERADTIVLMSRERPFLPHHWCRSSSHAQAYAAIVTIHDDPVGDPSEFVGLI